MEVQRIPARAEAGSVVQQFRFADLCLLTFVRLAGMFVMASSAAPSATFCLLWSSLKHDVLGLRHVQQADLRKTHAALVEYNVRDAKKRRVGVSRPAKSKAELQTKAFDVLHI